MCYIWLSLLLNKLSFAWNAHTLSDGNRNSWDLYLAKRSIVFALNPRKDTTKFAGVVAGPSCRTTSKVCSLSAETALSEHHYFRWAWAILVPAVIGYININIPGFRNAHNYRLLFYISSCAITLEVYADSTRKRVG